MNINAFAVIFLFLLFPGCSNNQSEQDNQKTRTLLVQTIWTTPTITAVIRELTPTINSVIKKELGLDPDYDYAFFIPKKRQRITLYYFNDILQKNESVLLSAIENMELAKMKPKNVAATTNAQFFGNQQDELVMIIDDPDGELSTLNQKIKAMAHQLHDVHKKENKYDFYNIAKSERYPFKPHMGIGRMRTQSIKNNIKNASETNTIFERIRTEIKKVTREILQKAFSNKHLPLSFNKFTILDLQKQIYIKEW